MNAKTRSSILAGLVISSALLRSEPALAAPPVCPSTAAVSTALRVQATGTDPCHYEIGGFDAVTIEIVATADVATEMNNRRADALRRSAPVSTTKVGPYRAFTGAAAEQSRLSYDQKGIFVFVAEVPIAASSAGDLKRIGAGLATLMLPKVISGCDSVTSVVARAVPGASFDSLSNSTCVYRVGSDATVRTAELGGRDRRGDPRAKRYGIAAVAHGLHSW